MNFRWHTRALLALGSGAALALSFPNYNLSLLAWIAVGMLVLASCGAKPAVSPLYGFLHGLVFYPIGLPWIAVVMEQYGNIDPITSAGILGLMAIAGGIVCCFFSLLVALVSRKSNALACLFAPFLWVTLEFARTHLPIIGFPWNLTGYAASGNLALVQLTPLTGIYGLSFVIAAYGSLLAYAILSGRQRVWKALLVTTAVLILIAAVGGYFVPKAVPDHVAHLVQTDFPQSEHYPNDWLAIHAGELDDLERISVDAAQKQPGLIVWPEVPAPFSLQETAFADRAVRIARDGRSYFLVGVVDWKLSPERKYLASNSAVLLNPEGQRVFTYDKIHLVPFGEYVPLRRWIKFAGRLTADISDFTPGTEYRVGPLPGGKFGVFICYEAIFPGEVRQFADNGAQLLINISNDGWFGRSAAPPQHLMMARVRAVENRRWLLRDTNNGYTVDVDPYGRIVASLPTDVRTELDAPYAFRSDLTLYARFGDWFSWLCVLASMVLLGLAFIGGGREKRSEKWT
ncbi:MAG TPA: apolipoprotein N-acyltransferase [Candidatus Limnocylindrales bacterium]|nr:apolipoprotein N-acyltransferase [Candidatus Limnocylindrales bacterium]